MVSLFHEGFSLGERKGLLNTQLPDDHMRNRIRPIWQTTARRSSQVELWRDKKS
jgi:hypothetical protein